MIAKTKKRRIDVMLKCLEEKKGEKKTLGTWLFEINDKLPRQNAFKSTKELAQAFRYIIKTLKHCIVKEDHIITSNNSQITNKFYMYMGEQNGPIESTV